MTYPPTSLNDAIAAGRMGGLPDAPLRAVTASASAVSWGAIIAGAAAAAALSLILLILGVGLGLSSVSPWASTGISASAFGTSTIVWITLTQVLASAMGGYLAGRLRTKWVAVHGDEVYFRDTAHGFLAWAIAALTTAGLLTSAIGSIVGGGIAAGASVTGGAAASAVATLASSDAVSSISTSYFVDGMFRRDPGRANQGLISANPLPEANEQLASNAEIARIFVSNLRVGGLPVEDMRYVAQVVAQRTGLVQADAEKRVTDTYSRMQIKLREAQTLATETADKARKASAYAALWVFISLLIGAFVASLGATLGGKHRDA